MKKEIAGITFGISLSVVLQLTTSAQIECTPSLACGISLNPASGSQVVAGQTITINYVSVHITTGSCYVTNGNTWMAYPDGTSVQQTELNYVLPSAPLGYQCIGTAGGGGAPCLAFTTSYLVNPADVGKTLQLGSPTVMPRTYAKNGNTPLTLPGIPKQIHFFAASEADGYNDEQFTSPSGLSYGEGQAFLTVVHGSLTITVMQDTNCYTYGSPISFHGSVCNTGSVTLANITVTDSPPAIITFAATTSSGRTFDHTLTNNECVNYIGSYQPTNNLCGPITNTVIASGVAATVYLQPVYYATNSATCTVGPVTILNPRISDSNFLFSLPTVSNHNYTVEFTDLLWPANWLPLTNFAGDGTEATIPATITNAQQFYRVLVQ